MAWRISKYLAVPFLAVGLSAAPAIAETLGDADATAILAPDQLSGPNWTVDPVAGRDGFSRSYTLKTPYGVVNVVSDRRLRDRLAELRALDQLEKVSKTETFLAAMAKAGLAPLRFGRDLITSPIETTENLFAGVVNIFDKAAAEIGQTDVSRDGTVDSILGVRKARRELAFTLGVDPYTDFVPLDKGLDDVAGAMAAGDISISAAFAAIPGGAGAAVSGTATANQLSTPVRDKSSAEIAELVEQSLRKQGVDPTTVRDFLKNPHYSPADQLAIADGLKSLNASGPGHFIVRAAQVETVDKAKFMRARMDTMADNNAKLGTIASFVSFADYTLARNKAGALVAVFPFDEIAWTPLVERSFTRMAGEIVKLGESQKAVLATSAVVSPEASAQLTKLGWKIQKL